MKKEAPKGNRRPREKANLERVDPVKLKTVEPWLDLTCRDAGRQAGIQQVAVQRATMPPGEASYRVGSYLPQRIDAMLQDVRRSPLIAFCEGGDHRILFLPQPRITELQVALVLLLADAEVHQVRVGLLAEARVYSRLRRCAGDDRRSATITDAPATRRRREGM